MLKHQPHTLDIVASMSPIALGIDVTKVEAFIKSLTDTGDGNCNLTCDEGGTTTGTLVVEEDAIGQVHTIGLTVVDQDPECILLRHSVGRTGVERSGFGLWNLLNFSVQFGSGRLVEAGGLFETASANSVKHAEDTNAVTVSGVLRSSRNRTANDVKLGIRQNGLKSLRYWNSISPPHLRHIERNLYVRHGAQVKNLIRLHVSNDSNEIGGITQVTVVEEKLDARLVTVAVDVIDAASVEGRRTADDAMDL